MQNHHNDCYCILIGVLRGYKGIASQTRSPLSFYYISRNGLHWTVSLSDMQQS